MGAGSMSYPRNSTETMPRKFFKRLMPPPEALRAHSALRPLGNLLQNPEIWHLHRRSVSGAVFIGLFCAFLPIPFQMLPAAAVAIATRCNLPVAVAAVWITNPLTMPPLFFFAYKLGAWLLNTHLIVDDSVGLSFEWLAAQFGQIWKPLLLGLAVCGWVSGVTGFVLVRVAWRLHVVQRWRARRQVRRARRAAIPPR